MKYVRYYDCMVRGCEILSNRDNAKRFRVRSVANYSL